MQTLFDPTFRVELSASARNVLEREAPLVPAAPPTAGAGRAWEIGVELGWTGIEIPEEHGGLGAGFGELSMLLREWGRAAASGPFFSSAVLGAGALALGDETLRGRLMPGLADGSIVVTAALLGKTGVPGQLDARATSDGDGWILHGEAAFVSDLQLADVVVVAARAPEPQLYVVPYDAPGITITATPGYDTTRQFAHLALDGVTLSSDAQLVASDLGAAAYAYLTRRAAIAVAADALGGAERIFEITLRYLRERQQFGRAIGSFQALKHRAVDVAMAIETARGAVEYAIDVQSPRLLATAAAIAKIHAGEAYALAAAEAVSLHGGIGYTLEHPAHVYLKRAKLDQAWFGSTEWHQRELAALALRGPAESVTPTARDDAPGDE